MVSLRSLCTSGTGQVRGGHIIRAMRLCSGRWTMFCLGALVMANACSAPPAATDRSSQASHVRLTGVWVAVGTFGDPAGPPPWSNTPWPANPPFTDFGRSESARLSDIKNVVPCQPGGPIFAMWNLGLFPIEILEAPDRIVIKPENSALPRRIHLNRTTHPVDLEPS